MPRRIVVFSSQGPGNVQTVLDFCAATRGARVVHMICDRHGIPSLMLAARHRISSTVVPIVGALDLDKSASVARRIQALMPVFDRLCEIEERDGSIDLIVIAFRKVLLGPILDRFGDRMINVHPSDLSVHNVADRRRRYVGIGGLKLAIEDGNQFTRTSIHRLDEGIDTGELICLGPLVPFEGDRGNDLDIARHEQVQKELSDRPALTHVLHRWLHDGLTGSGIFLN